MKEIPLGNGQNAKVDDEDFVIDYTRLRGHKLSIDY